MSDTTNIQGLGSGVSGFKSISKLVASSESLTKEEFIKELNYFLNPQASLLETFDNQHLENLYLVPFVQPQIEFSSLCPKTNQPDFAAMEIIYVPNIKMIESKSLKLYFGSYRNSGEFHEDVCNHIAEDLFKLLEPKYLRVYGNFVSRGSLAIKPLVEMWDADSVDSFGNESTLRYQIRALVNQFDTKK